LNEEIKRGLNRITPGVHSDSVRGIKQEGGLAPLFYISGMKNSGEKEGQIAAMP
jgi:hypothetical protein